ncbi:MAG: hypothetical protein SAK29_01300 [Scytonema sp. PMC 1069.18]|nr:hypothetical protein [Scytonema sp. PMC 1069.18]MEC4811911.1 hypothetical protein [Scytonema sp. PMC 1069.18]MEC4884986.1 hypothetical protein [Scytonema sp. PMC 1070.18]
MGTRKTGTVTGADLEHKARGKKGGLTNSARVTGESKAKASTTTTQLDSPSTLPTSDAEVADTDSKARANLAERLKQGGQVIGQVINTASAATQTLGQYASQVTATVKDTDNDRDPHAITNGTLDTADILAKANADVDESIPQIDSAEATKRNIIIARQRNYVGVAINNVKLKQDLATLDLEQQRLLGLLIDGKTAHVNNETKAVGYHRAVTARDTEVSRLEQDRELLTQQRIRTEGTQNQTELIREQEQLKVQKLREEVEKQKYEIENISYEKEKIKQEAKAKFLAGF